jgi:tetratricopeptide (TPR) repeat protein
MRSGNAVEAELEFEQIATSYPQLAAPDIDLGLLYRKSGDLDRSERSLREAVERDAGSALGWCELGVTLRMRGKFHDAEDAYKRAIMADAGFAPAYRNLGVLLDLYLGDAPGALDALEHYQMLTGEQEPVRGWIAELRRRAGKSPSDHGAAGTGPGAAGAPATDAATTGAAGATGAAGTTGAAGGTGADGGPDAARAAGAGSGKGKTGD